jgi:hypothetical protein
MIFAIHQPDAPVLPDQIVDAYSGTVDLETLEPTVKHYYGHIRCLVGRAAGAS